jgi:hypothetical protein
MSQRDFAARTGVSKPMGSSFQAPDGRRALVIIAGAAAGLGGQASLCREMNKRVTTEPNGNQPGRSQNTIAYTPRIWPVNSRFEL